MGSIDGDILTNLLKDFMGVFTLGTARLIPDVRALLSLLATLDILLLGLVWLYSRSIDFGSLAFKVLGIVLLSWIIGEWTTLTRIILNTFVYFGLAAGGGVISHTDISDPSSLAWFGISAMTLVYNRIFAYTGWDILFNAQDIVFTGGAATCALVAYLVLAAQVFYALLEFYFISGVIVCLVPFGVVRYTAFMAEKAFAYVWAGGLRLLLLSFLASVLLPMMQRAVPGLNPTFGQCVTFAIGGWLAVGLAWRGPKLAQSLLQGNPTLNANDLAQQVATTTAALTSLRATVQSLATAGGGRDGQQNMSQQAANAASNLMTRRRP